MEFQKPLHRGILIKRYKRFLADIALENGDIVTVHCPNSGSMKGLVDPGNPVALTHHDDPKRKLAYTLQAVYADHTWVGVNTSLPNRLVAEAIQQQHIPELSAYTHIKREVKYGQNSRIDLLLTAPNHPNCYVEIKNVTLKEKDMALFPDAVTTRGQKHLNELVTMVSQGHRAVMFYLVQRADCQQAGVAIEIDPTYNMLLKRASQQGVDVLCYGCHVTHETVTLTKKLPFII